MGLKLGKPYFKLGSWNLSHSDAFYLIFFQNTLEIIALTNIFYL